MASRPANISSRLLGKSPTVPPHAKSTGPPAAGPTLHPTESLSLGLCPGQMPSHDNTPSLPPLWKLQHNTERRQEWRDLRAPWGAQDQAMEAQASHPEADALPRKTRPNNMAQGRPHQRCKHQLLWEETGHLNPFGGKDMIPGDPLQHKFQGKL